MFIEPNIKGEKRGWIEVIGGSMFSGKTEELIRRLKRVRIANLKLAIFKPEIDTRYNEKKIVSHDTNSIDSIPVKSSLDILDLANDVDVVGIDEAQFFDKDITSVCEALALRGIRVIVAGLDMDFRGFPFGPIPALLSTAEYVTKVHAICMECGNLANHSHRFDNSNESLVLLGETDSYQPLCRDCFYTHNPLPYTGSSVRKQ
jgi:thymidine kinase